MQGDYLLDEVNVKILCDQTKLSSLSAAAAQLILLFCHFSSPFYFVLRLDWEDMFTFLSFIPFYSGLWSSFPVMDMSLLSRERTPWLVAPSRQCCPVLASSQRMRQMKSTSERFPPMCSRRSVCTSPTKWGTPTAPPRSPSFPSHQRLLSSSWWLQTFLTVKCILLIVSSSLKLKL